MKRAMLQMQKDKRVMDFCGENLKTGYWISVNEDPTENYIKFGFKIKGGSGDLGASIIADYLTHRELQILETERKDYFE
jgi:ribosomal protein S6E (S10)